MKNILSLFLLVTVFGCGDDPESIIPECTMSATVNNQELCYKDSHYLIAYASIAGEPSVFSISTPHTRIGDNGYYQISIETTEFTGPGTYTLRKYDGGSERSTYGYFFNTDIAAQTMKEYNSVSGTLVVERVAHIPGTSNGNANGTFTMTAEDDQGNVITIEGEFSGLFGMGWWD